MDNYNPYICGVYFPQNHTFSLLKKHDMKIEYYIERMCNITYAISLVGIMLSFMVVITWYLN